MENFNASEGERLGKRAGEKIGLAAEGAGRKLAAIVDYVEGTKQSAKQTLDQVRQDGWKEVKGMVMEYIRTKPFNAFLIAVGTGLLLGLLTKRARG